MKGRTKTMNDYAKEEIPIKICSPRKQESITNQPRSVKLSQNQQFKILGKTAQADGYHTESKTFKKSILSTEETEKSKESQFKEQPKLQ